MFVGDFVTGIFCDAKKSGEDADDIAVEERLGLIKGNAGNGAGGVASDAFESENGIEVARE